VGCPVWVVYAGDRQQNATFRKPQQASRKELDDGRLVDVQHRAVGKDDFDASSGGRDPVTGYDRNVRGRPFGLTFAFESDCPVDVRDMRRLLGICWLGRLRV
jgi:hypothetical protein